MVSSDCLMVDIMFPMLVNALLPEHPKVRKLIDFVLMALHFVGISVAVCVIKRGLWKIRHIGHNRKLVKDEAWKDIHMTVPRRIVVIVIISMSCYILY